MQERTRKILITVIKQAVIPVVLIGLLILVDQLSKLYITKNYTVGQSTEIIEGFFRFKYVRNTGSAFSFLAGEDWARTFFLILTPVALVLFIVYYIFIARKSVFARYSIALMIAGTIGNFIDRLAFGYVVDFLSFTLFGGYNFAVFNLADVFLVVGVIMVIFYYLFLDKDALIKIKKKVDVAEEEPLTLSDGEPEKSDLNGEINE